jgi:hypothetical protein
MAAFTETELKYNPEKDISRQIMHDYLIYFTKEKLNNPKMKSLEEFEYSLIVKRNREYHEADLILINKNKKYALNFEMKSGIKSRMKKAKNQLLKNEKYLKQIGIKNVLNFYIGINYNSKNFEDFIEIKEIKKKGIEEKKLFRDLEKIILKN